MRSLDFHYVFKHPFEKVVRAYFQKYSCGKDKNVKSVVVLEHLEDPSTGEQYVLRRGRCVNVLPAVFRKIFPYAAMEVEEEAWLNHNKQYLKLHSYNVTGSSFVKLEEYSVYTPCQTNGNWTVMEQTGQITAFGLGSVLGGMLESFAIRFFQHGADKGFNIMEDLLMSMSSSGATPSLQPGLTTPSEQAL